MAAERTAHAHVDRGWRGNRKRVVVIQKRAGRALETPIRMNGPRQVDTGAHSDAMAWNVLQLPAAAGLRHARHRIREQGPDPPPLALAFQLDAGVAALTDVGVRE